MVKEKLTEKDFYKVVKTSLKSVLKNPEVNSEKIQDAVIRTHKIITHSLQFLKLFLLDRYENGKLPVFDKTLIGCVIATVSVSGQKREFPKTKELMMELTSFYNNHYFPLTWDDVPSRFLLKGVLVKKK